MNAVIAIDTEVSEELLDSYLGRMGAPDDDEINIFKKRRWVKGVLFGSVLGLFLGLAGYLILDEKGHELAGGQSQDHEVLYTTQPTTESELPSGANSLFASLDRQEVRFNETGNEKVKALELQAVVKKVVRKDRPKIKTAFIGHKRNKMLKNVPAKAPKRLLKRGWHFYSKGDYQSAAVVFARAVHTSPRHTGGYYGLALCLFEQGKEKVALKVLERGAKVVGPKAGLWVLAGSIYQWMGKERMARIAYKRYLKNNPRGAYARDVRVILSRKRLAKLIPFDGDLPDNF